jgi:hypothetical protein
VSHLYQILCFAAVGARVRSEYKYTWFDDASPECARCGKGVAVASYLTREGATTTIPCASCGAASPTYPAPAWLKAQLPTALQVLGGDGDVAHVQTGTDLVVNEAATKPIAMPCPSCGGGLTIGVDTDRTVNCQFCSTSVFIPDELWKRLHPVKTMLRWTVTYTGKLTCEAFDKFEDNARKMAKSVVALIRINRDQSASGFNLDTAIDDGRKEFQSFISGSLVKLYEEEAATLRPSAARAASPNGPQLAASGPTFGAATEAARPAGGALMAPPSPMAQPAGAQRKFPLGIVLAVAAVVLIGGIGAAVALATFGAHESRSAPAPQVPARHAPHR